MALKAKIFLLGLYIPFFSVGQSIQKPGTVSIGIAASSAFTYTGINSYLVVDGQWRNHTLYAGPKVVLSDNYLPGKPSFGLNIGYSYLLLACKHWTSSVFINYESSYYRPYNAVLYDFNRKNRVDEFTGGLGLTYKFGNNGPFSISLNAGSGAFVEHFYDVIEGTKHSSSGISQSVRLSLHFKLFKI